MRMILIMILVIGSSALSRANQDSIDVANVITQLFDGMRAGDSSIVSQTFYKNVTMHSKSDKDIDLGSDSLFIDAVGTPHKSVWDERISNLRINVNGEIAQAWMNYTFFLDDKLLHCGVNAMQLVKTEGGWKIIHLLDTRSVDCDKK